jgi:hypothetical protein
VLASVDGHPLATSTAAPATTVAVNPTGTSYVPSNLNPALRDAAGTVLIPGDCELLQQPVTTTGCSFGTNPDAPLVVLFGDSHASQWFPALAPMADRGEIRVQTYTKSSCPAADIAVTWKNMPYDECTRWRDAVMAKLAATKPALVLLGAYQDDHATTDAATWSDGFASTIRSLASTKVALLVDTPKPAASVPPCLASHLDDAAACAVTLDSDFRDLELQIGRSNGVPTIDVTPYLCRGDVCPAIIGDTLVYRDGSHVTPQMTQVLGPVIQGEVRAALAGAAVGG